MRWPPSCRWIAQAEAAYDCLLLDVDNGPGLLSMTENGALYTEEGLRAAFRALKPGGVLAIWSARRAPECLAAMQHVFGEADEQSVPAERNSSRFEYYLLISRRPRRLPSPTRRRCTVRILSPWGMERLSRPLVPAPPRPSPLAPVLIVKEKQIPHPLGGSCISLVVDA